MFSAGAGTSDLSRPVVVTPPADWPPGLVISQGPVALARDQAGVYALLLVCPHLGCRPSWQAGQRLFVCPCHGSRFRADGSLARGPAARGLSHLTVETDAQNRLVVLPGRPAPAGARVAI
ncbi:MAG: Rieske 2Fe-2S domain-containing protein [Deltaproteobacteria bacterium]|nr:Rieske 2Fe-2S domain-containing protein [Deltaproteobacteria bacterium]